MFFALPQIIRPSSRGFLLSLWLLNPFCDDSAARRFRSAWPQRAPAPAGAGAARACAAAARLGVAAAGGGFPFGSGGGAGQSAGLPHAAAGGGGVRGRHQLRRHDGYAAAARGRFLSRQPGPAHAAGPAAGGERGAHPRAHQHGQHHRRRHPDASDGRKRTFRRPVRPLSLRHQQTGGRGAAALFGAGGTAGDHRLPGFPAGAL